MVTLEEIKGWGYPLIDFKFVNRGQAAALIWQITVEYIDARVDRSPFIRASFTVDDSGLLELCVTNTGWRPAHDFRCQIRSVSPWSELFRDQSPVSIPTLGPGESAQLCLLHPSAADPNALSALREQLAQDRKEMALRSLETSRRNQESQLQSLERFLKPGEAVDAKFPTVVAGIRESIAEIEAALIDQEFSKVNASATVPLEIPAVDWSCTTADGRRIDGSSDVSHCFGWQGILILSPECFLWEESNARYRLDSDEVHCAIAEPSEGAHVRHYPTSRSVPPGGVERFHILLAATKSCHLRLRFVFHIDDDQRVATGDFEVELKCSQDQSVAFSDGDVILLTP